ncbi:MAG TPA: RNA polymerase factor sigma-54, partial [Ignavibacteriaceae bacterium]
LFRLGEEIIGNLDDAGYLKRGLGEILNELELFEHIKIEPVVAEGLLMRIQLFDPLGIASRNLQECLLIQIRNMKNADDYYRYIGEKMLVEFYDDFTKRRFDTLKQKMNLTDEALKDTVNLIQSLNPKPGEGNIDSAEMNQISPDFLIEKVENDFVITLNDRSMPSVTISKQYLEMFESNRKRGKKSSREKETYKFLREKFESAKWFIACIQQRRDTLMRIMQAIFQRQFEFFEKGPKALTPMIYKDIAQEINMDISTISRVVNGKYVQSPQGIHELKYFFSEGLATDNGEEVSNKHIKERLKEIIDKEDKRKPFSDDKLAELLNEEGIHIARRTVAKYREQLRLPVARLRKEL